MSGRGRILGLSLPVLIVAWVASRSPGDGAVLAAAGTLGAAWLAMLGALAVRVREVRAGGIPEDPRWAELDVLTATGWSTLTTATAAIALGVLTGWASLGVLGVLGVAMVYLAATWTALAAGARVWNGATIERALLPATAVEGEPLREELRLTGLRIPAGLRLFAAGRATPRTPITRYALGSAASGADVRLERDLGPAPRGEHRAPPLALWFGDVLGLARGPLVHRGEAACCVLPRPAVIDGVRAVVGRGGDDAPLPSQRLPTEGTFRIRGYVPGDDTRRIHWVRSLQTDGLVVRLPDEVPQAEPEVRVVLDNHLWGARWLTCRAQEELLDALVRVWLGVGQALAEAGTRVTLVAAVDRGAGVAPIERPLLPRSPQRAARLGARVTWQHRVPLAALIARRAIKQVIVSSRAQQVAAAADVVWVVVPEDAWTAGEPIAAPTSPLRLTYPAGSAENRKTRRRRERQRIAAMSRDRTELAMMLWQDRSAAEAYVARPVKGRVVLEVRP